MRDNSKLVSHLPFSTAGFSSLSVPTHRASTIVFNSAEEYAARSSRGPDGYTYGLHGTPTTRALQARLSALESAERTALMPSGQAAIAAIFLSVALPGDKILIPDNVYPPVRALARQFLEPRGIHHEIYDPAEGAAVSQRVDARTRLVWVESPGSTTMEIQDVAALARAVHARGALVGCDNTWASPLLFKPLEHDADFSMEAVTKYVGGHSDLLMGSVSVRNLELHGQLRDTMRMLGMGVSPDDCFLAVRGLETMGVRIAHAGRVAVDQARWLSDTPIVDRVLHPALASSPGHALWERDFQGSSGVYSVVLKPGLGRHVGPALSAMKTFSIGASWGGTHSLIVPMTIATDRLFAQWPEDTVVLRLSIGLEDPRDLMDDLLLLVNVLSSHL